MATKNILKISPIEDQNELDVELINQTICISTNQNGFPIIECESIEQWVFKRMSDNFRYLPEIIRISQLAGKKINALLSFAKML